MKTDLTSENKVSYADDFPRLRLEQSERALIVCIEKAPEMEFVHTLRVPQLDDQGKVVKEEQTKNGKSFQTIVRDFVGQHRCFGDPETLLKSGGGSDPKNCPTCRAADEHQGAFDKPERRYAMHVLQYSLQGGGMSAQLGWKVAEPLTMKCVVWVFSQGRFNDLADLRETWEDLRKHDLRLGPCIHKGFQKYDMNMIPDAAWRKDKDAQTYAMEVYRNNRCPDLSALVGRKITREQALEDIATVMAVHDRLAGGAPDQGGPSMQANQADLTATVESILDGFDEDPTAEGAPVEPTIATDDLDKMFDKDAAADVVKESGLVAAEKPVASASAAEVPDDLSSIADTPVPVAAGAEALDLDSFLDSLDS